jgi:hypothetical protein
MMRRVQEGDGRLKLTPNQASFEVRCFHEKGSTFVTQPLNVAWMSAFQLFMFRVLLRQYAGPNCVAMVLSSSTRRDLVA